MFLLTINLMLVEVLKVYAADTLNQLMKCDCTNGMWNLCSSHESASVPVHKYDQFLPVSQNTNSIAHLYIYQCTVFMTWMTTKRRKKRWLLLLKLSLSIS